MRTINRICMLLFAIVFVISAVGCASAQPAGPVTIHVLTMDQAGLKPAEIDQIVKDFEAKNPDIKLNWENSKYTWITIDELKNYNTVPSLEKVLQNLL